MTKAMEMIAAAKMRKAVKAASESRAYTNLASEILGKLSKQNELNHPLTKVSKNIRKELLIMISSNRGLCGNFNSAVASAASNYINKRMNEDERLQIEIIAIGKKAAKFAKQSPAKLVEAYDKMPETVKFEDVLPIINSAINSFTRQEYQQVRLVYTRFITSLVQEAKVIEVLPISVEIIDNFLEETHVGEKADVETTNEYGGVSEYKFEPTAQEVVEYTIKRVLEAQFFQAFLESAASEHSSRMVAMKNASDAANDMIDTLTLDYNKSRQAAITQEIAEISNAAAAMSG
jgi:F-type H+-transporting ATPase subunit gamma